MFVTIETTDARYAPLVNRLAALLNSLGDFAPHIAMNYQSIKINLIFDNTLSVTNIVNAYRVIAKSQLVEVPVFPLPEFRIDMVVSSVLDDTSHMALRLSQVYGDLAWDLCYSAKTNGYDYTARYRMTMQQSRKLFLDTCSDIGYNVGEPNYLSGLTRIFKVKDNSPFPSEIIPVENQVVEHIADEINFIRSLGFNRDIVFRLLEEPASTHLGYCYWYPDALCVIDISLKGMVGNRVGAIQLRHIKTTVSHEIGHLLKNEIGSGLDQEIFADSYALFRGHDLGDVLIDEYDSVYRETIIDNMLVVANQLVGAGSSLGEKAYG